MLDRRMKLLAVVALTAWGAGIGLPLPTEAASTKTHATRSTTGRARKPAPKTATVRGTSSRAKASRATLSKASSNSSRSKTSRSRARQARAARLARSKVARQAREYREVATPLFRTDELGNVVPDVRAAAAVIYNPVTQEVLWQENADSPRSIASITKVMTAVVLLENEFDLAREIRIAQATCAAPGTIYVRAGETMRVDDVLHLMLIASDNAAARALARSSALGYDEFIDAHERQGARVGARRTRPTPTRPAWISGNVSSALDMARLIAYAANDERISPIMRKSEYRVTTSRRALTVHNTNRLVGSEVEVQGGKTGFIRQSGYCLATLLKLPQGDQVAVVVLGARSNAGALHGDQAPVQLDRRQGPGPVGRGPAPRPGRPAVRAQARARKPANQGSARRTIGFSAGARSMRHEARSGAACRYPS